jgi:hypothetical protein
MDDEPHVVHSTQHYEDTALRQTPGGECLCEVVAGKLPWRILIVEPLHNICCTIDQTDHWA